MREDDDYFSCITKAFDILGNPVKRKAFDSVDPLFDDSVPDALKKDNKESFYKVFAPVFVRNERWSNIHPAPKLGDESSTREEVDRFYSFWYDFDSWREYSYLDEEDKEKASDKWERKEIEKINRAQRADKKKDENKRIRKLVDNAYNSDPRIVKFREEEKQEKAAKKKAKQQAAKAKKDEEERLKKEAEEREQQERERIKAEERVKQEAAKKEKDAQKKVLKAERKKLRNLAKDNNMFAVDEDERINNMAEVEKICELYTVEQLQKLNEDLSKDTSQANFRYFANLAHLKFQLSSKH